MPDADESAEIRSVIQAYIDSIKHNTPDRMPEIFHPAASMSRHGGDGRFLVTTNPGADIQRYMKSVPPTLETSPNFDGEIVEVNQVGNMASGWIREHNLEGLNFNTFFHLHKVDGTWVITAKATRGAPAG
jgi:hypothetical protein